MALPSSAEMDGMPEIIVTGAEGNFTLNEDMKGKELLNLVRDRLPVKPKLSIALWRESDLQVIGNQTLKEQGLGATGAVQLSYSYRPADLWHAFKILEGEVEREVDHHALDGVVHVHYGKSLG
eukprot:s2827_g3.t1